MKRNLLKKLVVMLALVLVFSSLTGCHGTYTDSGEEGDQEIIIEDYTGEDDSKEVISDSVTDSSNDDSIGTEETTVSYNPADASDFSVFDGALFIGDSRTEGLQLYSGIKNADFFCAKGLAMHQIVEGEKSLVAGGDELSIQEMLDRKSYTKVYIGLGMNDLGMKYVDEFVTQYNDLIAIVKEKQPDAEIYIQALIPVTQEKSDNHEYVNNGQIYWYNTYIVKIAEDNGVKYINADAPLVNETGALQSDATTDGVHMNREYCVKWAQRIAELSQ